MSARSSQPRPAAEFFHAFYRKNRVCCALTVVLTVLSVPVTLAVSWLLGELLDAAGAASIQRLSRMVWYVAAVFVSFVALSLGLARAKARFLCRALEQYKALAFLRLSEKSISAFSRESSGRYLSAFTNDLGSIETNYLERGFDILEQGLLFVGSLALMLWYSPLLAVVAMVLSALPMAAAMLTGGRLTRQEQALSAQSEGFVARLKDLLEGFPVIKSFKAEAVARRQFDTADRDLEEARRLRRWTAGLVGVVSELGGFLMQFGIFLIGAYLAVRGAISGGTVIVFVNLAGMMINSIGVLPQYWAGRTAAAALVEKLARITRENAGHTGVSIPPVLERAITLEHVTFGYQPDQPVLREISLTLEAGKKYALVGASGSGKSTLLSLLMGADLNYTGRIAIDGTDLREVDPESLYDLMGLIGQNVFVFDATLRENLTLFRSFPDAQVDAAARSAGLAALLEQRGESYRCGERGANLSGGERQRLSIARCLLRKTPVLLLDEATAALDNRTAFAVSDAILRLDGLTRVVVTHRLEEALMERYDEIIVLRDGRIWERGSFKTLMAQRGYFYSLFCVA